MNDKIIPLHLNTPESWFLRMQESVDQQTEAEFHEWLSQPGNALAYEQCSELWGLTGTLADDPQILGYIDSITTTSIDKPKAQQQYSRRWIYAALSSAAAIIFFAILLSTQWESFTYYQTSLGEMKEITMEDGSTATLNTDSKIGVSYKSGQRHLILIKGEALFHVAKDKARPFVVSAGKGQVTAVGTQFNVWLEGNTTSVTVLEGKVSVGSEETKDKNKIPVLSAGQALRYGADGKAGNIYPADSKRIYAWIKGRLVFDSVPLEQVIQEYNRYTQKPLLIQDTSLQNTPISGIFQTGNTTAFVSALKELLPVTAREEENAIVISPAH